MRTWIRSHLTYANVMATIAVFFILSGGTAVALNGSNTVFSDDIVNGEVKAVDIKGGAVQSIAVRDDTQPGGGLAAADLAPNSVGGSEVADNSLTGADINDAALPTSGAAQDSSVVTVAGGGTNVVTGQITTTGTSRVLIDASAELTGADSDERAQCVVRLDGNTISLGYETTFDDIGTNNEATVSVVTSQNNVSAGTHTMTMNCASFSGTVVKDDAGINAIGIPAQ
jgi:hypothetical protein